MSSGGGGREVTQRPNGRLAGPNGSDDCGGKRTGDPATASEIHETCEPGVTQGKIKKRGKKHIRNKRYSGLLCHRKEPASGGSSPQHKNRQSFKTPTRVPLSRNSKKRETPAVK